MKERQILFSAPMVRAILEGQKTQTRRIVNPQPEMVTDDRKISLWDGPAAALMQQFERIGRTCPYGQPGDRLWVKETWQYYDWNEEGEPCIRYAADNATGWPNPSPEDWAERLVDVWEELSRADNYKIDGRARDRKWRPSIFMPRWASRILIEVVSVRVERLQEISPSDSIAEGIERTVTGDGWRRYSDPETEAVGLPPCQYPRHSYRSLWEHINGETSWDENPWVWVVEFKRIEPPKNGD